MKLTPDQQRTIDAAREALARDAGHGHEAMARRAGVLEHHLGEVLTLVRDLTEETP